jgi:hypothetical protein
MNVSKASCGVIAIAGAALAQLAGVVPAKAQTWTSGGDGSVALTIAAAPGPASGKDDRQVITVINDSASATLEIVNDKVVSASLNGKSIDVQRVATHPDRYDLLDEDGNVAMTIQRVTNGSADKDVRVHRTRQGGAAAGGQGQGGERRRARALMPAAPVPPAPPARPAPPGVPGTFEVHGLSIGDDTPKVMIGVNLAEPDPALLGHFGLKSGEATMFSGVYEGLPAASAGIGVYDIVLQVNGKAPAGIEDVRGALRSLNPGDTVRFTVLQRGQQRDVNVKVEPYSAERLSDARVKSIDVIGTTVPSWQPGAQMDEEAMRQAIEQAMAAGGAIARIAPTPGQTMDTSVIPLIRMDDLTRRERDANMQAMEAARKAEEVARALSLRAAEMDKRQVELKLQNDQRSNLEDRLARLERMLEKLLEEQDRKDKDR